MKKSFINSEKPLIVGMVQCATAEECIQKIKDSVAEGATAIGVQLCRLKREYRTKEIISEIFSYCGDLPIYVTSYRYGESEGMTDEECIDLLFLAIECGATLCDVMGDMFDMRDDQLTYNEEAVEKQKKLIDKIHAAGAEVLMSTHDMKNGPITKERILEIGKQQSMRGTDVVKIVVPDCGDERIPECIETLLELIKITGKKVLFLSTGNSGRFLRYMTPEIGNCMYLCVAHYNELDTQMQPKISQILSLQSH